MDNVPGKGHSNYKGPEVGGGLVCLRIIEISGRKQGEHPGRGDWRGAYGCMHVCRQITQNLVGHNEGFFV